MTRYLFYSVPVNVNVVVHDVGEKMMRNTRDQNKLRAQIRKLRKLTGRSQFYVARQSGVGRTRLSLYENGHIELQSAEIAAICVALEKAAADQLVAINSLSSTGAIVAAS